MNTCIICQKMFEQKANLKKHLRSHTSERCMKIFLSKSYNSIEEQYGILRRERSGRKYSSMKIYTQNYFCDVTLAKFSKYWNINSMKKRDKQNFIFQIF